MRKKIEQNFFEYKNNIAISIDQMIIRRRYCEEKINKLINIYPITI